MCVFTDGVHIYIYTHTFLFGLSSKEGILIPMRMPDRALLIQRVALQVGNPHVAGRANHLLRGGSRGASGLSGHTSSHQSLPKGSNVVPFWAVYYNPQEENRSEPKELHWSR